MSIIKFEEAIRQSIKNWIDSGGVIKDKDFFLEIYDNHQYHSIVDGKEVACPLSTLLLNGSDPICYSLTNFQFFTYFAKEFGINREDIQSFVHGFDGDGLYSVKEYFDLGAQLRKEYLGNNRI